MDVWNSTILHILQRTIEVQKHRTNLVAITVGLICVGVKDLGKRGDNSTRTTRSTLIKRR